MPATAPDPKSKMCRNFLCDLQGLDGKACHVQMTGAQFADGSPQDLYFGLDHPKYPGQFKGMRTIIEDRCAHGDTIPNPKGLKAQCVGFKCAPLATSCCLWQILYTQPDFVGQNSLLKDHCAAQGYQIIFLPKFHCELNFIEQCWGAAKRIYREFPLATTNTEDKMEQNAVLAVDQISLLSMRRCVLLSFLCAHLS